MAGASGSGSGSGSCSGSPCGACKFLRRKCATDCVFAPYFCSEQGAARFAAIHKVFGASNVSKLLQNIPAHDRCEAVVTIAYEAQARIRDPVYGCVANVFALQQQVAYLQAQLMQVKNQLAQAVIMNSQNDHNNTQCYWQSGNNSGSGEASHVNINPAVSCYQTYMNPISSPQSSQDSEDFSASQSLYCSKKKPNNYNCSSTDLQQLGELQELALRMMRN